MELAEAYRSYLDAGHSLEDLSEVVGKPNNITDFTRDYLNQYDSFG